MIEVKFMTRSGQIVTARCEEGTTLMEAGVSEGVEGILAECGGGCLCGTCHVYVDRQWWDKVGPRGPLEEELIDMNGSGRPNSRLSCQVRVTQALDGLSVTVAPCAAS